MSSTQALLAMAAGVLTPLAVRAIARNTRGRLATRLDGVRVSFATVVALGASMGGLAGMAGAVHLALRHLIERQLARGFSWDVMWMAPASGALIFGLLALLLAIAFPAPRGRETSPGGFGRLGAVVLAPCIAVLVTLSAYSVLQDPRFSLYPWSVWLLSLGFATLAVRVATARPEQELVRVIGRASRLTLASFGLLVVAGLWYLPKPREARALAALPPAGADLPNILLLVLDTVRAASMGLYGHPRPTTPNLEQLAARGVVFDWAIATAPWTLPSHGSMFTGLYPAALQVGHRAPLAEGHLTLAEVLRDKGYATAGFVANMAFTTRVSGLAQGFARYEDRPVTWGRFIESSWLSRTVGRSVLPLSARPWRGSGRRKDAEQNVDDFLGWLDARHGSDRPFFAFLNFIDAHDPYTAPQRLRDRFDPPGLPVVRQQHGITEDELASTRAAYEASIARIDEQLGRLRSELERRGLFERTLIIVTSDHGEQFGEHGLQLHGNSLYRPLIRVPLIMVYPPMVPGGRRIGTPVSIRDIPATVLHVVVDSVDRTFPGRSLVALTLRGETAALEPLLSMVSEFHLAEPWEPTFKRSLGSVFQFPYHLIRDSDGREELYRIDLDPTEGQDLAAGADPLLLQGLRHTLDSLSEGSP